MTINNFSGKYEFLSNFYRHPFYWQGHTYPTSEHAYQGAKATNLTDWATVTSDPLPSVCKKMGRSIVARPDWDQAKFWIMGDILFHKFRVKSLADKLLATGDSYLVEGNTWHDNIWGNCSCAKCAEKPGRNHLGLILMGTRASVRRLRGLDAPPLF